MSVKLQWYLVVMQGIPRFKHHFVLVSVGTVDDEDDAINKTIEWNESGGAEFVSVHRCENSSDWLLCFKTLNGVHEQK